MKNARGNPFVFFITKKAAVRSLCPGQRQSYWFFLRQYRIIEQEWFASKFCVLTRHSFAVILDVLPWNFGSADGTRARNRSQSQDTKFPQSTAALIVRCCLKLSVVREHTVLPYEIRLHIRLTCGRPGTCQNIWKFMHFSIEPCQISHWQLARPAI